MADALASGGGSGGRNLPRARAPGDISEDDSEDDERPGPAPLPALAPLKNQWERLTLDMQIAVALYYYRHHGQESGIDGAWFDGRVWNTYNVVTKWSEFSASTDPAIQALMFREQYPSAFRREFHVAVNPTDPSIETLLQQFIDAMAEVEAPFRNAVRQGQPFLGSTREQFLINFLQDAPAAPPAAAGGEAMELVPSSPVPSDAYYYLPSWGLIMWEMQWPAGRPINGVGFDVQAAAQLKFSDAIDQLYDHVATKKREADEAAAAGPPDVMEADENGEVPNPPTRGQLDDAKSLWSLYFGIVDSYKTTGEISFEDWNSFLDHQMTTQIVQDTNGYRPFWLEFYAVTFEDAIATRIAASNQFEMYVYAEMQRLTGTSFWMTNAEGTARVRPQSGDFATMQQTVVKTSAWALLLKEEFQEQWQDFVDYLDVHGGILPDTRATNARNFNWFELDIQLPYNHFRWQRYSSLIPDEFTREPYDDEVNSWKIDTIRCKGFSNDEAMVWGPKDDDDGNGYIRAFLDQQVGRDDGDPLKYTLLEYDFRGVYTDLAQFAAERTEGDLEEAESFAGDLYPHVADFEALERWAVAMEAKYTSDMPNEERQLFYAGLDALVGEWEDDSSWTAATGPISDAQTLDNIRRVASAICANVTTSWAAVELESASLNADGTVSFTPKIVAPRKGRVLYQRKMYRYARNLRRGGAGFDDYAARSKLEKDRDSAVKRKVRVDLKSFGPIKHREAIGLKTHSSLDGFTGFRTPSTAHALYFALWSDKRSEDKTSPFYLRLGLRTTDGSLPVDKPLPHKVEEPPTALNTAGGRTKGVTQVERSTDKPGAGDVWNANVRLLQSGLYTIMYRYALTMLGPTELGATFMRHPKYGIPAEVKAVLAEWEEKRYSTFSNGMWERPADEYSDTAPYQKIKDGLSPKGWNDVLMMTGIDLVPDREVDDILCRRMVEDIAVEKNKLSEEIYFIQCEVLGGSAFPDLNGGAFDPRNADTGSADTPSKAVPTIVEINKANFRRITPLPLDFAPDTRKEADKTSNPPMPYPNALRPPRCPYVPGIGFDEYHNAMKQLKDMMDFEKKDFKLKAKEAKARRVELQKVTARVKELADKLFKFGPKSLTKMFAYRMNWIKFSRRNEYTSATRDYLPQTTKALFGALTIMVTPKADLPAAQHAQKDQYTQMGHSDPYTFAAIGQWVQQLCVFLEGEIKTMRDKVTELAEKRKAWINDIVAWEGNALGVEEPRIGPRSRFSDAWLVKAREQDWTEHPIARLLYDVKWTRAPTFGQCKNRELAYMPGNALYKTTGPPKARKLTGERKAAGEWQPIPKDPAAPNGEKWKYQEYLQSRPPQHVGGVQLKARETEQLVSLLRARIKALLKATEMRKVPLETLYLLWEAVEDAIEALFADAYFLWTLQTKLKESKGDVANTRRLVTERPPPSSIKHEYAKFLTKAKLIEAGWDQATDGVLEHEDLSRANARKTLDDHGEGEFNIFRAGRFYKITDPDTWRPDLKSEAQIKLMSAEQQERYKTPKPGQKPPNPPVITEMKQEDWPNQTSRLKAKVSKAAQNQSGNLMEVLDQVRDYHDRLMFQLQELGLVFRYGGYRKLSSSPYAHIATWRSIDFTPGVADETKTRPNSQKVDEKPEPFNGILHAETPDQRSWGQKLMGDTFEPPIPMYRAGKSYFLRSYAADDAGLEFEQVLSSEESIVKDFAKRAEDLANIYSIADADTLRRLEQTYDESQVRARREATEGLGERQRALALAQVTTSSVALNPADGSTFTFLEIAAPGYRRDGIMYAILEGVKEGKMSEVPLLTTAQLNVALTAVDVLPKDEHDVFVAKVPTGTVTYQTHPGMYALPNVQAEEGQTALELMYSRIRALKKKWLVDLDNFKIAITTPGDGQDRSKAPGVGQQVRGRWDGMDQPQWQAVQIKLGAVATGEEHLLNLLNVQWQLEAANEIAASYATADPTFLPDGSWPTLVDAATIRTAVGYNMPNSLHSIMKHARHLALLDHRLRTQYSPCRNDAVSSIVSTIGKALKKHYLMLDIIANQTATHPRRQEADAWVATYGRGADARVAVIDKARDIGFKTWLSGLAETCRVGAENFMEYAKYRAYTELCRTLEFPLKARIAILSNTENPGTATDRLIDQMLLGIGDGDTATGGGADPFSRDGVSDIMLSARKPDDVAELKQLLHKVYLIRRHSGVSEKAGRYSSVPKHFRWFANTWHQKLTNAYGPYHVAWAKRKKMFDKEERKKRSAAIKQVKMQATQLAIANGEVDQGTMRRLEAARFINSNIPGRSSTLYSVERQQAFVTLAREMRLLLVGYEAPIREGVVFVDAQADQLLARKYPGLANAMAATNDPLTSVLYASLQNYAITVFAIFKKILEENQTGRPAVRQNYPANSWPWDRDDDRGRSELGNPRRPGLNVNTSELALKGMAALQLDLGPTPQALEWITVDYYLLYDNEVLRPYFHQLREATLKCMAQLEREADLQPKLLGEAQRRDRGIFVEGQAQANIGTLRSLIEELNAWPSVVWRRTCEFLRIIFNLADYQEVISPVVILDYMREFEYTNALPADPEDHIRIIFMEAKADLIKVRNWFVRNHKAKKWLDVCRREDMFRVQVGDNDPHTMPLMNGVRMSATDERMFQGNPILGEDILCSANNAIWTQRVQYYRGLMPMAEAENTRRSGVAITLDDGTVFATAPLLEEIMEAVDALATATMMSGDEDRDYPDWARDPDREAYRPVLRIMDETQRNFYAHYVAHVCFGDRGDSAWATEAARARAERNFKNVGFAADSYEGELLERATEYQRKFDPDSDYDPIRDVLLLGDEYYRTDETKFTDFDDRSASSIDEVRNVHTLVEIIKHWSLFQANLPAASSSGLVLSGDAYEQRQAMMLNMPLTGPNQRVYVDNLRERIQAQIDAQPEARRAQLRPLPARDPNNTQEEYDALVEAGSAQAELAVPLYPRLYQRPVWNERMWGRTYELKRRRWLAETADTIARLSPRNMFEQAFVQRMRIFGPGERDDGVSPATAVLQPPYDPATTDLDDSQPPPDYRNPEYDQNLEQDLLLEEFDPDDEEDDDDDFDPGGGGFGALGPGEVAEDPMPPGGFQNPAWAAWYARKLQRQKEANERAAAAAEDRLGDGQQQQQGGSTGLEQPEQPPPSGGGPSAGSSGGALAAAAQAATEAKQRRNAETIAQRIALLQQIVADGGERAPPFLLRRDGRGGAHARYKDIDLGDVEYRIQESETFGNCLYHSAIISLGLFDRRDPYYSMLSAGALQLRRDVVNLMKTGAATVQDPGNEMPAAMIGDPIAAKSWLVRRSQWNSFMNNAGMYVGAPGQFFKFSFAATPPGSARGAERTYDPAHARYMSLQQGRAAGWLNADGWPEYNSSTSTITEAIEAYSKQAAYDQSFAMIIEVEFLSHLLERPICVYSAPENRPTDSPIDSAWATSDGAWMQKDGLLFGGAYSVAPFGGRGHEPILLLKGTETTGAVPQWLRDLGVEYPILDHFRPIVRTEQFGLPFSGDVAAKSFPRKSDEKLAREAAAGAPAPAPAPAPLLTAPANPEGPPGGRSRAGPKQFARKPAK